MSALTDFSNRVARAANRRTVASDLRRGLGTGPDAPEVAVDLDGEGWPYDIAMERTGGGYRVIYPAGVRQRFVLSARLHLAAYLAWFHAAPAEVRRMTVTASDGDQPSRARFSPSSRTADQIPLPDPHFYRSHGFAEERRLAAGAAPWGERSDAIVWRGVLNGPGRLDFAADAATDPTVNARLRLVMRLHGVAGTDARISGLPLEHERWPKALGGLGYLGEPLPQTDWLGRKFAIDIDGHANTWSNFLVRMLFGCCILKVDSQFGFRQWYYDRLKPFEHFIPIRADMTDFAEKIDWARTHDREAREIAAAGQRFAMALDFEAGKGDAVAAIAAHWDDPQS